MKRYVTMDPDFRIYADDDLIVIRDRHEVVVMTIDSRHSIFNQPTCIPNHVMIQAFDVAKRTFG
jgi:hypothetical protein